MKLIPGLRVINYRKEFPTMSSVCYRAWFSIRRYWSGKIIHVNIRHFALVLDFRSDFVADMMNFVPRQ